MCRVHIKTVGNNKLAREGSILDNGHGDGLAAYAASSALIEVESSVPDSEDGQRLAETHTCSPAGLNGVTTSGAMKVEQYRHGHDRSQQKQKSSDSRRDGRRRVVFSVKSRAIKQLGYGNCHLMMMGEA